MYLDLNGSANSLTHHLPFTKGGPPGEVQHFGAQGIVVRGVTTVQTNQKAAFRSRGTNGPISVQQKVM